MTIHKKVSIIQNRWHDAQRVDQADMEIEQSRNNEADAAIVHNHFGSGILISSPIQNVLFDSDALTVTQAGLVAAQNFDGTGLEPHAQPSDNNTGNQLEIELSNSAVFGRFSIKVAIIGLSFDNTLQMDRFVFNRNEKQVSARHYKKILAIFTNDFKGNNNCSKNLGGRLTIKETTSFQLSKHPVMVAQDVEPDIFWRDFKKANPALSLMQTVQNGIGNEYSVDDLDINTSGIPPAQLLSGDVTFQIGQKFLAKTNNIQKITLLLGVEKNIDLENEFDWSGDLVVSIYPLQTTVNTPSSLVPSLSIQFEPSNIPLVQLSYNQNSLKDYGYVLNDVLQPVDFVFNATKIGSVANNGVIELDKFYIITVKRSGASNSGTILVGKGKNRLNDSCISLFNDVWVDVFEENLWFQVWTDAAKFADGQGYDNGYGISVSKTIVDENTGAIVDNVSKGYPFVSTGEGTINTAVVQVTLSELDQIQNESTGNKVFSRSLYTPSFSFVTTSQLDDLKLISEPLILGCIQDTNPKNNSTIERSQNLPGLVSGDEFCILNPDPDLLSTNLLGSKLIPNTNSANHAYRIFRATSYTDGYGDVNGDGKIDVNDIARVSTLVGESYYYNSTQQKINDGYLSIFELLRADVDGDGYITSNDVDLINNYVNRVINNFPIGSYFTHLCLQVQQLIGRNDGYYDCGNYIRTGTNGSTLVDPHSLSEEELLHSGYLLEPIINLDPAFSLIPFEPVTYRIEPQPFWQSYLLMENSQAKQVSATFTSSTSIEASNCQSSKIFSSFDRNEIRPSSDPGKNDYYIPDNLIIGKGEILRADGSNYAVDFEIGTVILQLPQIPLSESAINVFDKFIADQGQGVTRAGYPAMRYADCTTVQPEDLVLGKIRFNVSLQSFSPNIDGYTADDDYGIIVDDIIGVHMNGTSGILRLTVKDLYADSVYQTLVTKIQIIVYLKKAGWKNTPLIIDPTEVNGLISN